VKKFLYQGEWEIEKHNETPDKGAIENDLSNMIQNAHGLSYRQI
jgi:hypothetical protein